MNRICPIHGLWKKDNIVTRCPKCKTTYNKHYDKHKRNKANDKFYHSKQWKITRQKVLDLNPLCVECGAVATVVDHIQSIKTGGDKLSLDNLQSMCTICHNKKENLEGNRWKSI